MTTKKSFTTLLRKINTVLNLKFQGKLLTTLANGETDWQRNRRANVWKSHMKSGTPVIDRLSDGEYIQLYPQDRLSERIFMKQFEQDEQQFIRKFLRTGDNFVDAGANIGLYTIIAAKKLEKNGRVFAFEPSSINFKKLLENVELNRYRNVVCVQAALSHREEQRDFVISLDGFGAHNSLACPTRGNNFGKESVSCIPWEKFSSENGLNGKITLMKIDVEGWELNVLTGGEKIFSQDNAPDVLIEFTEANAQSAGLSCQLLFQKITELGYGIYFIDLKNKRLVHQERWQKLPHVNLFATKREDFVLDRLNFGHA